MLPYVPPSGGLEPIESLVEGVLFIDWVSVAAVILVTAGQTLRR